MEAWRRALDEPVRAFPVEKAGPAHIATLKTFEPPLSALEGRRLAGAERRGKRLLFPTEDGELVLLVHLMTAGRLRYLSAGEKGPKTPAFALEFETCSGPDAGLALLAKLERGEAECKDHLLALLMHRPSGEAWDEIERAQAARVRDLRARLERFSAASSHDRRHRITADEQRAADDAAAFLGGDSAEAARPRTAAAD